MYDVGDLVFSKNHKLKMAFVSTTPNLHIPMRLTQLTKHTAIILTAHCLWWNSTWKNEHLIVCNQLSFVLIAKRFLFVVSVPIFARKLYHSNMHITRKFSDSACLSFVSSFEIDLNDTNKFPTKWINCAKIQMYLLTGFWVGFRSLWVIRRIQSVVFSSY